MQFERSPRLSNDTVVVLVLCPKSGVVFAAKEDLALTREQRSADVKFLHNLKLQCNDLDKQYGQSPRARPTPKNPDRFHNVAQQAEDPN